MARRAPEEKDLDNIVYGVHPVEESLSAGRRCRVLYLKDEESERGRLASLARKRGIAVRKATLQELARLSGGGNHQGAAAEFEPFRYTEIEDLMPELEGKSDALVVLLDSIKDTGNLGAILRTAAAAGADAVMIPKDRAASVTPAAVRASAGAADSIPVVRVVNLVRAMEALKKAGFWIYGTAADGARPVWDLALTGKVAFVLGEEESGMRRLVSESCDENVHIPMPGRFESLNVSAAAAVVLFETLRQRQAASKAR
jgi:23S rRNA (guanosine2251-2'-O)-methyltransferase